MYRIYIHNYLVRNNMSISDLDNKRKSTNNFLVKNRNSFLLKL